ncbi:MAG: cytochrome c [Pseudomonadota bacterium]
MRRHHLPLVAPTVLAIAGTAFAAGHADVPAEIKARQGLMNILALNLGTVGNMARGNTDYDAEAAQIAADSLVAVTAIPQSPFWTPGTSTADTDQTRALPAIWEDNAGFGEKFMAFAEAASGLQAVAGDGLEPLQGAVQTLGRTCGGCHDDYRQPSE